MAFEDDKEAILLLVKAKRCPEAKFINTNAGTYAELLEMLFEFASTFDCDPAYLNDLLTLIDDTILTGLGVYFNKAGTQTNPKVIVNSNYTNVTIDAGGAYEQLQIFNGSVIDELIIENNTLVDILAISGGSEVTKLQIENGSCVNAILVKACQDFDSKLDKIVDGSCVKNLQVDENATFNGYTCELIEP